MCILYVSYAGQCAAIFLFAAMPFVGYCCFDRAFALIKKDVWRNVFCAIVLAFTLITFNSNTNQLAADFSERFAHYLEDSYPGADSRRVFQFAAYDFLKEYTDKNAMIATNYQGGGTFHEFPRSESGAAIWRGIDILSKILDLIRRKSDCGKWRDCSTMIGTMWTATAIVEHSA